METSWVISAMDCNVQEGEMTNVVITVHWRFQGRQMHNDKQYFAETYGATTVSQPNPESFTPFDQLTEEQVVGWLEAELDVAKMTEGLQANIDLQITPTNVVLTPPWIPTPSPTFVGTPNAGSAPVEE
jgi:hypothetical protein